MLTKSDLGLCLIDHLQCKPNDKIISDHIKRRPLHIFWSFLFLFFSGFGWYLHHQQSTLLTFEAAIFRGSKASSFCSANICRKKMAFQGNSWASFLRSTNKQRHHHFGLLGHRENKHHPSTCAEQLFWAERYFI